MSEIKNRNAREDNRLERNYLNRVYRNKDRKQVTDLTDLQCEQEEIIEWPQERRN